jgi:hypothetical protein
VLRRTARKNALKSKNGKPRKTSDIKRANEKAKRELEKKTASMIDSLVEEYSVVITRRLRDELTSILENMENREP